MGRDAGPIADGAGAGDGSGGGGGGGGSGSGGGSGGGDGGGGDDGGSSGGRRRSDGGDSSRRRIVSRDHPLPGSEGDIQRTTPSTRAHSALIADRIQRTPREVAANDPPPEMFAVGEVVEILYDDETSPTGNKWYVCLLVFPLVFTSI